MRKATLAGLLALAYALPESAGAVDLKQETLKSIPSEYLSRLLISTRAALTDKSAASSFGASPWIKQLSTQFFLVAPSLAAVQNEGHSTVILPIKERTICVPQKS